jgi:hypothetical protein
VDEIDHVDYDDMEIDQEKKNQLNFKMIDMKCLRIIQSILEKIREVSLFIKYIK